MKLTQISSHTDFLTLNVIGHDFILSHEDNLTELEIAYDRCYYPHKIVDYEDLCYNFCCSSWYDISEVVEFPYCYIIEKEV